MSNLSISANEFEEKVLKTDKPVMVDFYADWCVPCKMIAPFVTEIAEEFAGKADVFKLNVDEAQGIAIKYNIRSIPAVLFFKGGEATETIVGAYDKSNYQAALEKLI